MANKILGQIQKLTPKHLIVAFLALCLVSVLYSAVFGSTTTHRGCQKKASIVDGTVGLVGEITSKTIDGAKSLSSKAVDGVQNIGTGIKNTTENVVTNTGNLISASNDDTTAEVPATASATSTSDSQASDENLVSEATTLPTQNTDETSTNNEVENEANNSVNEPVVRKLTTEIDVILNIKTADGQSLTSVSVPAAAATPTNNATATTEVSSTTEVETLAADNVEKQAQDNAVQHSQEKAANMSAKLDKDIEKLQAELEKLIQLKEYLSSNE